jgi:hypothetical protein
MGFEYIAVIAEEDYHAFRILVSTPLPREYDMWLRVRERGRLRIIQERDSSVVELEVRPEEFGAYCKSLKKPDFSITALDRCAHAKAIGQSRSPAFFAGRRAGNWLVGLLVTGLLALAVNSVNAASIDCLSSAAAVREADPKAWPTWTLRAPGHEGSKCWYAATRSTSHDYQQGTTIKRPTLETEEAVASPQETYGFAPLMSEVAPREVMPLLVSDSPSSFAERFSAVFEGNFIIDGTGIQHVLDLFRGLP